jgi:hypothetical protein
MPLHLIPQDKANHQAYGARVAMVCATLAMIGFALLVQRGPAALVFGAAVALLSAWLAGTGKERLDARANAKAAAAGETVMPHSVERGDVRHTVYGGAAVAVPLAVAGLLLLRPWARVWAPWH